MDRQKEYTSAQYCFPPKSLLKRSPHSGNKEETKGTAAMIQQTLFNFGVKVRISNIYVGARFTRYEIVPEPGVRVEEKSDGGFLSSHLEIHSRKIRYGN